MTTTFRTHFTFRVDTWTPDGESIVEQVKQPPETLAQSRQASCGW